MSAWRLPRLASFAFLIAVGYVDPGNWAIDIAAGSRYGYALVPVVLLSGLAAVLLQQLAARLSIVTGLDLAQACAQRYSQPTRIALWLLAEGAIVACDLAELIGSAIALQLLFGLTLIWGVWLTAFDVLLLMMLQSRDTRQLATLATAAIAIITMCFVVELMLTRPAWTSVLTDSAGVAGIAHDPGMLMLAIGIVGATVMPHNLYLQSALSKEPEAGSMDVRTRRWLGDNARALGLATLLNAAILILAGSAFHTRGLNDVAGIAEAHRLLGPLLGSFAGTLFALALLASGQSSTMTGTLAGQVVLEGFTGLRIPAWQRRLVSRLLAIVPAVIGVTCFGAHASTRLLVLSQVALSVQLPFAMIPLITMTSDRDRMGALANGPLLKAIAWIVASAITAMDVALLVDACA